MESRIAIIGIIVEDIDASSKVNDILHDYGMYIPVSYTHLTLPTN